MALDKGQFRLQGAPPGTTVASVTRVSKTEASVTLAYGGALFSLSDLSLEIDDSQLDGVVDLRTNAVRVSYQFADLAVPDWPQNSTMEPRRTLYQSRRVYGGSLTDPVTFGDRPLWNGTLDWGINEVAVIERIVAQIEEVALVSADWGLYLESKRDVNREAVLGTWGGLVSAYSYGVAGKGTITFRDNTITSFAKVGDLMQVDRYVLKFTDVVGNMVRVANLPERIKGLSNTQRNAMHVRFNNDKRLVPLYIQARILDAKAPAIEYHKGGITARAHPITIVEEA